MQLQREGTAITKKDVLVFVIGLLSFLYLLNPGLGLFEFLPDALPVLGNLDEGTAVFLLLSSLSYYGLDLRNFWKRDTK